MDDVVLVRGLDAGGDLPGHLERFLQRLSNGDVAAETLSVAR